MMVHQAKGKERAMEKKKMIVIELIYHHIPFLMDAYLACPFKKQTDIGHLKSTSC